MQGFQREIRKKKKEIFIQKNATGFRFFPFLELEMRTFYFIPSIVLGFFENIYQRNFDPALCL